MDNQFNSKTSINMAAQMQRNRELVPGLKILTDILNKDTNTNIPIAGKYMANNQQQNNPAPKEEEEQLEEEDENQQ